MSSAGGSGARPLLPPATFAEEELPRARSRWPQGLLLVLACGAALALALTGSGNAHFRTSAFDSTHLGAVVQLAELAACAGHSRLSSISGVRYPYLKLEEVVQNNLGGHGPDRGFEGIIYECSYAGGQGASGGAQKVLLEVHATSGYRPHAPHLNGRAGGYGVINLEAETKVELRFRLTAPSGEPVTLPALALTFLDLDEDGGGHGVEYITVGGFHEILLTEDTEVETAVLGDGRTLFHASRRGTGEDNPIGNIPPSQSSQKRAIGLLFTRFHEVRMTLGVGSPGRLMRVFMFVSRPFPCTMTTLSSVNATGVPATGAAAANATGLPALRQGRQGRPLLAGNGSADAQLALQSPGGSADLAPRSSAGRVVHGEDQRGMLSSGDGLQGDRAGGGKHLWVGGVDGAETEAARDRYGWEGSRWTMVFALLPLLIATLLCIVHPGVLRRARTYRYLYPHCSPLGTDSFSPLGAVRTIASRQAGDFKWSGIVALGTRLYCIPFHADDVLVVDADTHATRAFASGTAWNGKWSGAAAWKEELYCAPFNADEVLVVDTELGSTYTIAAAGADGDPEDFKWAGVAALGERLYCAPHNAGGVLVIDPATGQTHTIETGRSGAGKWHGIAALGGKLYCAPFNADDVLVVDPEAGTAETIPTGQRGNWKWAGIAALDGRLYCAPHDADDVLVVDPAKGTTWTISTGRTGVWKWSGIAACGDCLYCAPCCADDILVVQPSAGKTEGLATGCGSGGHKWAGIAAVGTRLYCAPSCADDVLEIALGGAAVNL